MFLRVSLLLFLSCIVGCRQQGCSEKQTVPNSFSSCKLLRVLGRIPQWGGACRSTNTCWRMRRQKRMEWTKCVAGKCLFGATDPQKAHLGGVLSFVFSPNGQIFSGDAKGDIRLWDVHSGLLLKRWRGHRGAIRALAITPKGFLLSAGDDDVVRVWWPPQKQLVGIWKLKGRISRLAVSKGGRWLAAASTDRAVWLRRLHLVSRLLRGERAKKERWIRLLGHTDAVRGVAFDVTGRRLLSASDDRTIRLWDVAKHKLIRVFKGHQGWVRQAVFSPVEQWVVSVSFDQTIRVWGIQGRLLHRWGIPVDPFQVGSKKQVGSSLFQAKHSHHWGHKSDIRDVSVSPDGRTLLAVGHRSEFLSLPDDGMVARLWDIKTGKVLCQLKGHRLGLTQGAFGQKSNRFATSSEDGTIRVYLFNR